MKKLSLFVAMAMLLSMCTFGVAQAEIDPSKLEPYEVTWYSVGTLEADHQMVVDEINKVLKEKFNCTLNLIPNTISDHRQKMTVMAAAREKFDLAFVDSQYVDFVAKEAFYPLNDLLQEYGQAMLKAYPANLWDAVRINGEIYAVPTHKFSSRQIITLINETMAEKFKVDCTGVKDWESFQKYCYDMKAAGGDANGYIAQMSTFQYFALYPMESLTGNTDMPGAVIIGDQSVAGMEHNKVFNQFATPEFKAFCEDTYALAQAGCLPMDPDTKITLQLGDPTQFTQDTMSKRTPGLEKSLGIKIHDYIYNNATQSTYDIYGSMNAISDTSEDPARAMMILNLMNESREFSNLVRYGIEGVHYVRNENNQIDLSALRKEGEGKRYYMNSALLPGFMTADPDTSLPLDMNERYAKYGETLMPSENLGFAFDVEPVKSEYAAITNVSKEYLTSLVNGWANPAEALPKFLSQLEASGLQKLMEEEQRQLDAWRQAQGK